METIRHQLYDFIRSANDQQLRALHQLIDQELEQRSKETAAGHSTPEESFSLGQLRQSMGQIQSRRLENWAPLPQDRPEKHYTESIS